MHIAGKIVDIVERRIFNGILEIKGGYIVDVEETDNVPDQYILPGFIDAHIHIESSMLTPLEFSKVAVKHGTIAVVSDPHEIANVLGVRGVEFMIENSKKSPLKIYFGAPSCVPATNFESSGAVLGEEEIEYLFEKQGLKYLSEMMNFPGVIHNSSEVISKINMAKKYNAPIDGHASGVKGEDLIKYVNAGISTDHECFTFEEAIEKIKAGMKIQIREGSAAKNFNNLIDLIDIYPDRIMFCSDDLHPDDLLKGHINLLVKRALRAKKNIFSVLRAVSYNIIQHYKLDVGMLQKNDFADFIIMDNLNDLNIKETWINGEKVFDGKDITFLATEKSTLNNFNAEEIDINDIQIECKNEEIIRVIKAIDGELITQQIEVKPKVVNNRIAQDIDNDILKIVVINRYQNYKPSVAFIKGFGIKSGAIASSIAHDSHNIIAVGTNDKDLVDAINLIIQNKGGITIVNKNESDILQLPVAGIISNKGVNEVAYMYENLTKKVNNLGSTLKAPFMTLSFMALIVIPKLKISDKGLFDVEKFAYVEINAAKN